MKSSKSQLLEYLRRRRTKEFSIKEIIDEISTEEEEILVALQEMESLGILKLKKEKTGLVIIKKTTQEIIIDHLLKNRGREIPVSEIAKTYNLKRNTISNAIRALEYDGKVETKSFRKKGQFTMLRLPGDRIIDDKEVKTGKRPAVKEKLLIETGKFNMMDHIEYLRSNEFDHIFFREMTDKLKLKSYEFIVEYVTPLMRKVGHLWADNRLSTGEEHVITSRMEKLLIELINERNNKKGDHIFLVPVESEYHTLALLSLELLLTDYNFKVTNLGKPLPAEFLIRYIKESNIPDWIFLTITLEAFKGTLTRELRSLREVFGAKVKIAIGGQGLAEEDRNRFPDADFVVINQDDLSHLFKNILAKETAG